MNFNEKNSEDAMHYNKGSVCRTILLTVFVLAVGGYIAFIAYQTECFEKEKLSAFGVLGDSFGIFNAIAAIIIVLTYLHTVKEYKNERLQQEDAKRIDQQRRYFEISNNLALELSRKKQSLNNKIEKYLDDIQNIMKIWYQMEEHESRSLAYIKYNYLDKIVNFMEITPLRLNSQMQQPIKQIIESINKFKARIEQKVSGSEDPDNVVIFGIADYMYEREILQKIKDLNNTISNVFLEEEKTINKYENDKMNELDKFRDS